MKADDVFAGVPVADYQTALAWYQRFFGRPPSFFPHDTEAVWQLGEHAFVYVVGDAARAGYGLLTLLVDDLDRELAELEERGVAADALETLPGKVRKGEFTDPEGNRITLGQPLG